MGEERKWFGIAENGPEILGGNELIASSLVQAISQNEAALGVEVCLDNNCAHEFGYIPDDVGKTAIDIVIGDPRLVRNVTIVERGTFESLSLPDSVLRTFGAGEKRTYELDERLIVFRTEESELLYVFEDAVTLLENVVKKIGNEFLEGLG